MRSKKKEKSPNTGIQREKARRILASFKSIRCSLSRKAVHFLLNLRFIKDILTILECSMFSSRSGLTTSTQRPPLELDLDLDLCDRRHFVSCLIKPTPNSAVLEKTKHVSGFFKSPHKPLSISGFCSLGLLSTSRPEDISLASKRSGRVTVLGDETIFVTNSLETELFA